MPKLEQWLIVTLDMPYDAPEKRPSFLQGIVSGHPRFKDGTEVTTSKIVGLEDGRIRTNSGSLYELGEPDAEYEQLFPGAKERVFKSLEGIVLKPKFTKP